MPSYSPQSRIWAMSSVQRGYTLKMPKSMLLSKRLNPRMWLSWDGKLLWQVYATPHYNTGTTGTCNRETDSPATGDALEDIPSPCTGAEPETAVTEQNSSQVHVVPQTGNPSTPVSDVGPSAFETGPVHCRSLKAYHQS